MTATITVLAEKGSPLSHTEMDNNFRALRNLMEVPTVAAVRSLGVGAIPAGSGTAITQGCLAAGDGGGGTWRWDAASTATDNTGTVLLPTGHIGAGRWLRVFEGPVNVRWFGAVGDGVTDDTAAVQAALNAGDTLLLPSSPQAYLANAGTLTIPADVTLLGEHNSVIRYDQINLGNRVRVVGVVFDGGLACQNISLSNTSGVTLERCTFQNIKNKTVGGPTYCIDATRCVGLRVQDCVFDTCQSWDDGIMANTPGVARFIYAYQAESIEITGCIFRNLTSTEDGDILDFPTDYAISSEFPFLGTLPPTHPDTMVKVPTRNILIKNNQFYLNDTKSAIKMWCGGITIQNNYFELGTNANGWSLSFIRGESYSDVTICNNVFHLKDSFKIRYLIESGHTRNLQICNNLIHENRSLSRLEAPHGDFRVMFYLVNAENMLCADNTVDVSNFNCLFYVSYSKNALIRSNTLIARNDYETVLYPIFAKLTDETYVNNNRIDFIGNHLELTDPHQQIATLLTRIESSLGVLNSSANTFETDNASCVYEVYTKKSLSYHSSQDRYVGFAQHKFTCINTLTSSTDEIVFSDFQFAGRLSFETLPFAIKLQRVQIDQAVSIETTNTVEVTNSVMPRLEVSNYSSLLAEAIRIEFNSSQVPYYPLILGSSSDGTAQIRDSWINVPPATASTLLRVTDGNPTIHFNNTYVNGLAFSVYSAGSTFTPSTHLLWRNGPGVELMDYGTTAQRPAIARDPGFRYFDTTLGKPIWYSGSAWVDATGTSV